MESEWMGRYRPLVAEMVRHTNIIAKEAPVRHEVSEGIFLNNNEWQVLEYIVEHRFDDDRMIYISEKLSIPQSTFSKIIKNLVSLGLAEKYQMSNNKKNIIVKPTDKGLKTYLENVNKTVGNHFSGFFSKLERFSDEDIAAFTEAIRTLNTDLETDFSDTGDARLIKVE